MEMMMRETRNSVNDLPLQATVLYGDHGEFKPALARGVQVRTAPFTTHDRDTAQRYAEFAAERNSHNNIDRIVWPERSINTEDSQQPDHAESGRWTAKDYDGEFDGYPILSPEGLAAIVTDPEYQQRILTAVNNHDALVAALKSAQACLHNIPNPRSKEWDAAIREVREEINAVIKRCS